MDLIFYKYYSEWTVSFYCRIAFRLDHGDKPNIDFSIDPSHELALYTWDNGKGPVLTHSSQMCLRKEPHCASYPNKFKACVSVHFTSVLTPLFV